MLWVNRRFNHVGLDLSGKLGMALEESTIKAETIGVPRARPLATVLVSNRSLRRLDGFGFGDWHNFPSEHVITFVLTLQEVKRRPPRLGSAVLLETRAPEPEGRLAFIVSVIAWAYVNFGKLSQTESLFYGIKPVIIAVVVQAMWNLGCTAVKTPLLGIVGAGAIALGFHINPLLVLLSAGAFMLVFRAALQPKGSVACLTPLLGTSSEFRLLSTAGAASTVSLWPMFLFFLKAGAVMFGSGYVLLAFLRADLVEHWHWLTESQLLDAVAVGQFTPGPFLTTATFIGYVLGGSPAALVATVAIFLPSFVLVAVSGPLMPRLLQSRLVRAFLDGVNVASLALMIVVTWQLGRTALVDWLTISLTVAAVVWLLWYRVNSTWLILGGAALGLSRFVFQTGP